MVFKNTLRPCAFRETLLTYLPYFFFGSLQETIKIFSRPHRVQVAKHYYLNRAKLPLKLTCPTDTSTCPATLLNKGDILEFSQNITCRAGQVRVLFSLPLPVFCRIHLQLATGQWLCCMLPYSQGLTLRFQARGPKQSFDKSSGQK